MSIMFAANSTIKITGDLSNDLVLIKLRSPGNENTGNLLIQKQQSA